MIDKRLKELATKAGISFKPMTIDGIKYQYQHVHLNDYTKGVEDEAGCIKLFAKLIIKECANICDEDYTKNGQSGDGWRLARKLEKHFGVKDK